MDKTLPCEGKAEDSSSSVVASEYERYGKGHYERNKAYYVEKAARNKRRVQEYVIALKASSPCMDCLVEYPDEPWLMEFDHVSGEKTDNIGTLARGGSLKKIRAEIAKCEIVCLICHRRRTAKRAGWKYVSSESDVH